MWHITISEAAGSRCFHRIIWSSAKKNPHALKAGGIVFPSKGKMKKEIN